MPWTSLRISPGFVRNTTRYATSGTWFDGSLVRFRDGLPEKWAGWEDQFPGFSMTGIGRSLHRHGDLSGRGWTSVGTSKGFYMVSDDLRYDVTPLDEVVTLAADPFTTTNGSSTITITDNDHGHFPGDRIIISGATDVGGIPAIDINGEHQIDAFIDDDHFTIEVATVATSDATGGGAAVELTYLFRPGTDDVMYGGGWGYLGWGDDVWGGDPNAIAGDQIGIWSQDNWGEDLVANAFHGPIFYWDATNPEDRMVNILDLPGADGNAPAESAFIVVSHRDRHLLSFGCTVFGGVNVEPMTFRWCNQEDIYNWNEADLNGTAGSLPLSNGSRFVAGIATAREIIAWSDQAMYSIQYIGNPYIYTAELLERWSDICGLKACCAYNGVIYWMGTGGFYAYAGRTEKLQCPVWDYIATHLNQEQAQKVYASSNQNHNEVLWFYPSSENGNTEIDSYVSFDVGEGVWTFGKLARSAWLDLDALNPVIAVSPTDSRIYQHDVGADDGSTNPPSPLNAYCESGPIELSSEGSFDKGDRFMFIRSVMPDVTFRDITTSSTSPTMNLTLKMMDYPGGGFISQEAAPTQRFVEIPVEQFTKRVYVRLRGRSMSVRAESSTLGTNWRMGVVRIDARTDGQK